MKMINIICFATGLLISVSSWAQTGGVQLRSTQQVKRYVTPEINMTPLVAVTVPGISAFGIGVEAPITDHLAPYVEFQYGDANLNNVWTATAVDLSNEPTPDNGYNFGIGGGLRLFNTPVGDSWYGDVGITYSEAHNDWVYDDDATYDVDVYTTTPSVGGGYRWVWPNNIVLRAGIDAGLPQVNGSTVSIRKPASALNSDQVTTDGKNKVEDIIEQTVIASVDLALGYNF